MHISRGLVTTGLLVALGTSTLHGQQMQVRMDVRTPDGSDIRKSIASRIDPAAFKHVVTGPTIAAVLKTNGQYSQFLTLVERVGLLPLLQGTTHDTTYAAVTFREAVDSVQNPLISVGALSGLDEQLQKLPSSVNKTDIKEQATNMLDSIYTEARKYALAQDGLLTVFAPTNAAFAALPKEQLEQLTHDSTALATFVRAHIVTKGVYAQGLPKIQSVQSLAGSVLPVGQTPAGAASVGGISVVGSEVVAGNGVVHGLAAVLPWPTAPGASAPPATP